MRSTSNSRALAAATLLVLAGCVDVNPTDPSTSPASPSLAILDGSTGGSPDFYFLPPISDINPNPVGTFNPNLLPAVSVCELEGDPGTPCTGNAPIALFAPGAAVAGSGQYTLSWDTDGPETDRFNTNKFYRLEVLVADSVMGWIELDPQKPNGPGQSTADAYAFRVGETIPVKFWLSTEVLCTGDDFVTECITGAVIDETGGSLALEQEGDKLGVIIFEESLPGANHPPITVTIERIDADLFLAATGVECIPLFDAPQFGSCIRINTTPELDAPLDIPALVSVCLDPTLLDNINLSEEQQNQLTMVRFADTGNDAWEALPDAAGDCPTTQASLLRVPESGLFKYAALGINAVADFVGPQPLVARDIRLGGLTTSFSRFRYALPGQMIPTAGDGTVIQTVDPNTIDATINVVDHEGIAVENAIVHFATIDGTLSSTTATTDVAGNATVQWTVDRTTPGAKTLNASALGLLDGPVPEHSASYDFVAESVDLTVTVVGPPADVTVSPTGTIEGTAGESAGDLTIQVSDAAGNPISGADVTWSGDGTVTGGTQTGTDGSATGEWTLPTGAGDNQVTATVGDQTGVFNAVGAAGPAIAPTYEAPVESATAGAVLATPVAVILTDQYGNPREGDDVTWAIVSGGGSVTPSANSTGLDGRAEATLTLGETVGDNVLSVSVAGFETSFTVAGLPGDAVQPSAVGDGQTGVVGLPLGSAISVVVTDEFGNPREGDLVSWSGDGTFASSTSVTDASGVASVVWTLGTAAGAQSATAATGTFSVTFSATAEPGEAAVLTQTGGGVAPIGSLLPLSLSVTDEFGNPRSGDAVTWTVTSGGGSIDGSATTTDGSASADWTLGSVPGTNEAFALVGGLRADFTATGECFAGWGTASVDGDFGLEWSCAQSLDFAANVSGGSTPATVYWMNDDDRLYFAVRVMQASVGSKNSVRLDIDNDGDGVAEAFDDIIGYDVDLQSALDQYLTAQCANRNQSGCGRDDRSADVVGAVSNDGTYTTYELSQGLAGDARGEDMVAAVGDHIGFFLTLRVGNGAQGNTQVPGFRNYQPITIVGLGN